MQDFVLYLSQPNLHVYCIVKKEGTCCNLYPDTGLQTMVGKLCDFSGIHKVAAPFASVACMARLTH